MDSHGFSIFAGLPLPEVEPSSWLCTQAYSIPFFRSSGTSIQVPENPSVLVPDSSCGSYLISKTLLIMCTPLTSKLYLGLCLNCCLGHPQSLLTPGLHLVLFSLCYRLNCVPPPPSKSCWSPDQCTSEYDLIWNLASLQKKIKLKQGHWGRF